MNVEVTMDLEPLFVALGWEMTEEKWNKVGGAMDKANRHSVNAGANVITDIAEFAPELRQPLERIIEDYGYQD